MAPVLSHTRRLGPPRALGIQGIGPETQSGFVLLAAALAAAGIGSRTLRVLAGCSAGLSRILWGAGWLLAAFGLVWLDGLVARACPGLSPFRSKALMAALAVAAGGLGTLAAYRIFSARKPDRVPAFLQAFALLLAVLGFLFPLKRFLVTRYTDKHLELTTGCPRTRPGDVWATSLMQVKCGCHDRPLARESGQYLNPPPGSRTGNAASPHASAATNAKSLT